VREGTHLTFGPEGSEQVEAEVVGRGELGSRHLRFSAPVRPALKRLGEMPLPPYIHQRLANPERYQTVYARAEGSAAAPTAGLHFTPRLIDELKAKGIGFTTVVLHVGLDTFRPVHEANIEEHKMHLEWYEMGPEAARAISDTRARGGRIVAVGTTSVRTLETVGRDQGLVPDFRAQPVEPASGWSGLFIAPGYDFSIVDAMLTNFHLPRTTLIMLVSAFAGRERVLAAYREAVEERYRFFSFGDAMLIV
jgi:S-adenosylmethionine:tRNA ribosyltransferase-isomerase